MARAVRERPKGSSGKETAALVALLAAGALSFLPVSAYHLAGGQGGGWNPLAVLLPLAVGKTEWPQGATFILACEVVLLAAVAAGAAWAAACLGWPQRWQGRKAERRLDRLATTMSDPREVPETDPRHLAAETDRLAPAISTDHRGYLGLPLGTTVVGGRELRMPWEWACVAVAGTRMGKTAALAVPALLASPGAAIVTSNKSDLYRDTWQLRQAAGEVWLLDLQGVVSGDRRQQARFWFDPLRHVDDLPSAQKVMDFFVSAATEPGARTDGYFDPEARDLLGSYILAAALAGGDMLHVVAWLRNTQSQVAPTILEQHGYRDLASSMLARQQVNARQRDGFYGMARRFLNPLDEPRYARSVLPNVRKRVTVDEEGLLLTSEGERVHDLPELDVAAFVRGTGTIYAMSKEGPGSAAAIGTALTGSVLSCAELHGAAQDGGRLPLPMTAVLDEAANVCRLKELPAWYSHFGSRGIILTTIVQSPEQARRVWGTGFAEMLSAANIHWYGGSIDDENYIESISKAVGDHYVATESRSGGAGVLGSGPASVQRSWQRERILDASVLKALPSSRAVVQVAGSMPLLVKKGFWFHGPMAAQVHTCREEFDRLRAAGTPPAAGAPARAADAVYGSVFLEGSQL